MADAFVMAKQQTVPPSWHGQGGGTPTWADGQRWSSGQTGLFSADRFAYVGSFRPPFIGGGTEARFGFNRGAVEYDNNSLLVGCHNSFRRRVARISIPTPVVYSGDPTLLPRATMLSAGAENGFVDITDGQWVQWIGSSTSVDLGSMCVHNGKIYWVQEPFYDGENVSANKVIGFSDNTSNLLTLNGVGPSTVGSLHYKNVCRNALIIPEAWANTNVGGRRLLMGCWGISVRAGGSEGPVAVAVDLPTAASQTLTSHVLMRFPEPTSTTFTWPTTNASWDNGHWNFGMAWIEDGTDHWLLMSGVYYFPPYSYKGVSPCSDPGEENGYWGYPHRPYLMVFNMADVLVAANPWDVMPREIIDCREFTIKQGDCTFTASGRGGIAWDATNKRLFYTEVRGDSVSLGETQPVWHVLELDGGV